MSLFDDPVGPSSDSEMVLLRNGYALRNIEAAIADAQEKNYECVRGDDHTLLLDIDSDEDFMWFTHMLGKFAVELGVKEVLLSPSKSGNRHIQVKLWSGRDIRTRALLEATLGSDRKRALLNWFRAEEGIEGLLIVPDLSKIRRIWPEEGTFEMALLRDDIEF